MRKLYWEVNTHYCQAPITDSFKRAKQAEAQKGMQTHPHLHAMGIDLVNGSPCTNKPCTEAENEPLRPEDGEMTFL